MFVYDPETEAAVVSLEDSEFTATEESTASSEQCQINVNLLF
jgi:hypothetical protein